MPPNVQRVSQNRRNTPAATANPTLIGWYGLRVTVRLREASERHQRASREQKPRPPPTPSAKKKEIPLRGIGQFRSPSIASPIRWEFVQASEQQHADCEPNHANLGYDRIPGRGFVA